ncbi:MAG TPA: protein kinase, partial [Kofleriaceae bacterium]|nr:protein kinase [Kofleriaceae bacterium]
MSRAAAEIGSTANSYQILAKLATGGMAEIFLARGVSGTGVERYCVLKRILRDRASDVHFVRMFLDEARIGALLNHPNIVHVYDVDEHDGIPYIAMEYIVGEELNELCRRGIQHDRFLPLEHAVE